MKLNRTGKTPQLQAPRPKELQKILTKHQNSVAKALNAVGNEATEKGSTYSTDEINQRSVMFVVFFLKHFALPCYS